MNFEDYLKVAAHQVDQQLDIVLGEWRREASKISSRLLPLIDVFIEANKGGKRLRGILVKLGYELAHGRGGEIIQPAVAFEVFQTAILAHDDIMDRSALRRGKPTIYQILGGDHYGISQAICLGDIGFFLAVKLIGESDFPDERKNRAICSFANTTLTTALGQMLDVAIPHDGTKDRAEEEALTIFKLKTARYTIVGPMILGAILGGADQKLLDNIKAFGEALGIAFQIQDDILGVFGDEESLGKSVTSDIEEGKNTLLVTQALKKASPAQRKILKKYYGRGNVGSRGLIAVRQVFVSTGSLDYSRQQALKYVSQAKKIIPRITQSAKYARLLSEMADFLVERSK